MHLQLQSHNVSEFRDAIETRASSIAYLAEVAFSSARQPGESMKTLHLLRHAHSDWEENLDDHERPLTSQGRRACAQMDAALQALTPPEVALCSSATRALETYECTQHHWTQCPELRTAPDLYLASPTQIRDIVEDVAEEIARVLIVGHQPGLQQLALSLSAGGSKAHDRLTKQFPTGAIATLELPGKVWKQALRRTGKLTSFIAPQEQG